MEAGNYVGRAVPESLIVGETKNGVPQVAMNLEILNEGYEGQIVGWYGTLKGGATAISIRQMRAAGWTGESFADPSGLGSCDVPVRVFYENYEGEPRMKVTIGGGGVRMEKPITGGALAALDARFKSEILKGKPGGTAKPAGWVPPPRQAPATPHGWDGQGPEPPEEPPPF